jgi:RNA polymerase sigma-70 factor (ECF subfamily)
MGRACTKEERPIGWGRGARERALSDRQLADLLEAVRLRKDLAAFTELFSHYAPRLRSLHVSRGASSAVAEELTQEAMLAVWRRAELYDRRRATVSTWIYTIARNKQTDLMRRRQLDDGIRIEWQEWRETPDEEADLEAGLHLRQSSDLLHKALQSLPSEQEQVLRKAYFEAKSHQKIAAELGLPLGTVKSRIRLALGHLRATPGCSPSYAEGVIPPAGAMLARRARSTRRRSSANVVIREL